MPWLAHVLRLLKLLALSLPLLNSPQALYPALQWAQHCLLAWAACPLLLLQPQHQGLQGLPPPMQLEAQQRMLAWKAQDARS